MRHCEAHRVVREMVFYEACLVCGLIGGVLALTSFIEAIPQFGPGTRLFIVVLVLAGGVFVVCVESARTVAYLRELDRHGSLHRGRVTQRTPFLCWLDLEVKVRLEESECGESEFDCFVLPSHLKSLRKGDVVAVLWDGKERSFGFWGWRINMCLTDRDNALEQPLEEGR
jgi:hypothetical protein